MKTLPQEFDRFATEAQDYSQVRRRFWEQIHQEDRWSLRDYYQRRLAVVYSNNLIRGSRVLELGCGTGNLLAAVQPSYGLGIDFSPTAIAKAQQTYPQLEFKIGDVHDLPALVTPDERFDYVILSDLVNDVWDVQVILEQLKAYMTPQTRLILNFYNKLWAFPLAVAQKLGVANRHLPQNWLLLQDMENLLEISGFQTIRSWEEVVVPLRIPLLTHLVNRSLTRLWPFRGLSMVNMIVSRLSPPIARAPSPRLSVIIAARNESGHIAEIFSRIPELGGGTEIIFVEGNSSDDTYETIAKEIARHPQRNAKLIKQTGKGKGDAVRAGFEAATGDILVILDADITVPPEDLVRFFQLLADGRAEFVNGVRLVYPMEDSAMRLLNLVGNKFFSAAFSWLLGQPIRDTLCGTKALWRADYERIKVNRRYFGDFDPFGDFDLLFGAAKLNLKILEVPVRYRARRYGETNIQRWSHGWLLLRMVIFAARRIKFI